MLIPSPKIVQLYMDRIEFLSRFSKSVLLLYIFDNNHFGLIARSLYMILGLEWR